MSAEVKVIFDSIYQEKKSKDLLITGWVLDISKKISPEIKIVNQNQVSSYTVERIRREDVNQIYATDSNEKAGFQIQLNGIKKKNKLEIIFSSGDATVSEWIYLGKKYPLVPGTEGKLAKISIQMKKGLRYLKSNGISGTLQRIKIEKLRRQSSYPMWLARNEKYNKEQVETEIQNFYYTPKLSVIIPVYNVEEKWLQKCIESITQQAYSNWELCVADDASTDLNVAPILKKYAESDDRIKVVYRKENGHISAATNSALQIATGEFIVLMDNDDELPWFAFYEVVKALNENKEIDLLYSDEDKIDMEGNRSDPAFKPDWSPDLLLGTNYISHLGVYRRSIVNEIGGFRKGYEGSQDYDLVLRFTEKTTVNRIKHIPKVLYHWRMLPTSTAADQSSKNYAYEAGLKALQDTLQRRREHASAVHGAANGLYDVNYDILKSELVSIIIPTKDGYKDLRRCVTSIIEKTSYQNYEIIIADNGSTDKKMLELYTFFAEKLEQRFKVVTINISFNFSKINNQAVQESNGKYILFLNNDTEVISTDWLSKMVSFAQFERVGCVGGKLLYPNNTIQHAGVILGLGGIAGHGHYGYPHGDLGYFGRLKLNVDYAAVTAACLLVKRTDFDKVAGFDEELTVAFNDVDFCLKIKKLGKDNVYLHQVELYHFESQTRGYEDTHKKKKRFEEEEAMMRARWGKWIENDPYYNPNLTRDIPNYSFRT